MTMRNILSALGVAALGVNFWPHSKRFLAPENAGWLRTFMAVFFVSAYSSTKTPHFHSASSARVCLM